MPPFPGMRLFEINSPDHIPYSHWLTLKGNLTADFPVRRLLNTCSKVLPIAQASAGNVPALSKNGSFLLERRI